jgi:hypothetical protein
MPYDFLDIAVTPAVRAAQAAMGSDGLWTDFKGQRASDRFSANEAAFIADRDSFYMATVSATGWPYVQHRGGPRGFLKMVDDRTLAFADYRGNRQYISVGNTAGNERACLFLMDYAQRARLKIYVHAEVVALDADPALAELVAVACGWKPSTGTVPNISPRVSPSRKSRRRCVRCAIGWRRWNPKMLRCRRSSWTRKNPDEQYSACAIAFARTGSIAGYRTFFTRDTCRGNCRKHRSPFSE